MHHFSRAVRAALMIAVLFLLTGHSYAAQAFLYRDAYGVPHIFSASEEAGMYAAGFAQAEDRLEALLRNYKQARGELAEIDGPSALSGDVQVRAFALMDQAKAGYTTLSPQLRADIEAFCAGVNRYQKENPARRPSWAFDVTPLDVVTFAQFINLSFAMDAFEQLPATLERGSNAFALASKKTASGRGALLSIDPHLPWTGYLRWYQMHLSCGPIEASGVTFVGIPMVVMGHNKQVAWANTVNYPDLSDIYEERLVSPFAYEYDGGVRPLIRRRLVFQVRQPNGALAPVERDLLYTHHGPLLLSVGGKHYSIKKAGVGDLGLTEQIRSQSLARNVDEYRTAIAQRHVVMFNHLFADSSGRIGYVWGGQIPTRSAPLDFRSPVPGWTGATEWGAPVAFDLLPQVQDPLSGFLQNCNDAPFYVTPNAPVSPSADPSAYPFWLVPNMRTLRGIRMTELLQSEDRFTVEEAKRVATDVLDLNAARQLPALLQAARAAVGLAPADQQILAQAVAVLSAWDMRLTARSQGAVLFSAWLSAPNIFPKIDPILSPLPFELIPPVAVRSPAEAVGTLLAIAKTNPATLYLPWGAVHRHQRGAVDLPLDGGGNSLVPTKDVPDGTGRYVATFGSSFRMLVELGNGPVRAWSALPYGNSDDPASPHYTDQMPLAATRQYRPVPFTREEVEAEATSRLKLKWPEEKKKKN